MAPWIARPTRDVCAYQTDASLIQTDRGTSPRAASTTASSSAVMRRVTTMDGDEPRGLRLTRRTRRARP